jgi:hypothetical protein
MANLATLEQYITTAIGQQETSGGTAGVGLSLNNPGAMEYQPWESAYGATLSSGGRWAKFPSMQSGWDALKARVAQLVGSGASLTSLVNTYAPPSDNNTNNHQRIAELVKKTGLDPAQPVKDQVQPPSLLEQWGAMIPPDVQASANPDQAYIDQDAAAHPEKYAGGSTWSRVAAFCVGILCLGLGILLLRQSQVIIQQTGKAAASAAAAV